MTREQWDELFVKVGDMPVEELEKIIVDSARKAGALQTNYDLLISRTPEEMAVWFCECMLDCCGCPAFGKCIKYDGDANERSKTAPGLVDWLKAPVEEVDQ